MAIRNIVKDGDSILLKKCRPVEKFDKKLHELLDDMTETLAEANGAGLAAPQVGMLRQVCIVQADPEGNIVELINPEILHTEGEQLGIEGCLSFPEKFGLVRRPNLVTVKAQDRNGDCFETTVTEFEARAFLHEIDHLNGVVYTCHVERMISAEELESGDIPELKQNEDEASEEQK